MDEPEVPTELDPRLLRGLEQFDAGEHYDAHETLEELWMGEVGATRHLLQALIQLTIALHHRSNGNISGSRALLERALEHLAVVRAETCFVDPRQLERAVEALRAELVAGAPEEGGSRAPVPRFDAVRARIAAERRARALPER